MSIIQLSFMNVPHTISKDDIDLPFVNSSFLTFLVGGFSNPLKNISQIGSLPQVGVKTKNI